MNTPRQKESRTAFEIIDGRKIAAETLESVKAEVASLRRSGVIPGLAAVIVGSNPMSALYVKRKKETAISLGMRSFVTHYDEDVDALELKRKIKELNDDSRIHGILVQLPLPAHINVLEIINEIDPSKDVDGFTLQNIGKLVMGEDGLFPCTPLGCLHLIKSIEPNLRGLRAVVVGKSNVVGRPMSNVLLNESCTVTVINRDTSNPAALARKSDILISATGQAGLITEEWVNKNMIVIDVGISQKFFGDKIKLVGDAAFDDIKTKVRAITPVPGGVGPMTIAYLMKNTLKAASNLQMYENSDNRLA